MRVKRQLSDSLSQVCDCVIVFISSTNRLEPDWIGNGNDAKTVMRAVARRIRVPVALLQRTGACGDVRGVRGSRTPGLHRDVDCLGPACVICSCPLVRCAVILLPPQTVGGTRQLQSSQSYVLLFTIDLK